MKKIKSGFKGERAHVLPEASIRFLASNPLSSGLYITDIGYYPHAENHYRERVLPIGEYVFIYCIEGEGWFECRGKRYDISENQYFVLPPETAHSYGADTDNPWTIYWIHFSGSLANAFFPEVPIVGDLKPGVKSRIADRLDIFEEIMMVLGQGYTRENLLYVSSVFHHFLGTLRFLHQYRMDSGSDSESVEMIKAAIHYMEENICRRLKLTEVATYIGYSPSRFSEVFKKRVGCPPMEYFNRVKIKYACRLLEKSKFSVQQISNRIGIEDPYYFSRLFKKEIGVSPSSYRDGLCSDCNLTHLSSTILLKS